MNPPIIWPRATTLVGIAIITFVFISTACGSGGTAVSSRGISCVVDRNGGLKSRIKPHNSDLTCAQIQSILLVLPDAVGVSKLESNAPNQGRTCRVYPPSAYPLEVRCYRGKRYFEVVGIPPR